MPLLPPLPMQTGSQAQAIGVGLCHAGLRLGEDADIFRRNPIPPNYDNLLEAIRQAKQMIARAEEQWGGGAVSVQILHGDCRDVLKTLPDASVQCCVTSPPYFGLRDYGVDGQLGLEQSPDAYIAELVSVFREVRRVLRDDGCVFLNLGDSYYNSSAGGRQGKTGQRASRTFTATGSGGGSQHEGVYDKRGKAPEGSPGHDCLCGSLCDACRAAYRLGKSHSDRSRVPTLSASRQASSPSHTELAPFLPPMSDFQNRRDRNVAARHDLQPDAGREVSPQRVSLASTRLRSLPPPPGACSQTDSVSACLSCGRSLPSSIPASVDRTDAHAAPLRSSFDIQDRNESSASISATGGASDSHTKGMACDCCSYQDCSTAQHHSLKNKDLIGIPWMAAFALRANGWWLRRDIIWSKPNPMPESVTDRPTSAHEYVFLLTKSARYFWDAEAVREPVLLGNDGSCSVVERQGGTAFEDGGKPRGAIRKYDTIKGANCRSVWAIATSPLPEAHFATFPPTLAERCILAGTSEKGCCSVCGAPWARITTKGEPDMAHRLASGSDVSGGYAGRSTKDHDNHGIQNASDVKRRILEGMREKAYSWGPVCQCDAPVSPCVVLDPFGGAGTVGLVADRLGRNAILIELNPSYIEIAKRRLTKDAGMFAEIA